MKCAEISALLDDAFRMLPAWSDTPAARVLLIAIGLQESKLHHRFQVLAGGGKGPARGLWQFERGGGVRGVLEHPATERLAGAAVESADLTDAEPNTVWLHLEHDDTLAARFARLLLWTDPRPLPARGDATSGWNYYLRNWRPGKPHQKTWNAYWRQAEEWVYGANPR